MKRRVYKSYLAKLRHDNKLLWIVIFTLASLNIGQLYYSYIKAPSNEVISNYQKEIAKDKDKIKSLQNQLNNDQGSYEKVTFTDSNEGINDEKE